MYTLDIERNIMNKIIIDRLGRIVIPVSMRRSLDLKEGSQLDISLDNDRIVISRSSALCRICYTKITVPNEFCICEKCMCEIKKSGI